jgi:hypothetical protein
MEAKEKPLINILSLILKAFRLTHFRPILILIGTTPIKDWSNKILLFRMVYDVPVYFRDQEASLRALPPAPNQVDAVLHTQIPWYTDKKENHILLIYMEIQNGAVANAYMTNLFRCD